MVVWRWIRPNSHGVSPIEEEYSSFSWNSPERFSSFGPEIYPRFSPKCREYFYLPHRKKERGVGGLFFDHLCTDDFDEDLKLWKDDRSSFLNALIPIYRKRNYQPFYRRRSGTAASLPGLLCRI